MSDNSTEKFKEYTGRNLQDITALDIFRVAGFPIATIVSLAIAWGSLTADIKGLKDKSMVTVKNHETLIQVEGDVTDLNGRILKIELWKDDWIARVLPLDADQSGKQLDFERRIGRLEKLAYETDTEEQ